VSLEVEVMVDADTVRVYITLTESRNLTFISILFRILPACLASVSVLLSKVLLLKWRLVRAGVRFEPVGRVTGGVVFKTTK